MVVSKGRKSKQQQLEEMEYILSVIDVGFSYTKILSNLKGAFDIFPSAVAFPRNASVGNMKVSDDIDKSELMVEIDGVKSYVGDRALIDMSPDLKRTRESDRANDKISRVLFRTAIALSLPDVDDDFENVHVVTGLPNRDYTEEEIRKLEEFLLEPFTIKFHVNKLKYIEKRISVSKVTIYPQPLGSYTFQQYRYGNVPAGERVIMEKKDFKSVVGMIDIGQLTTDYCLIVDGEIEENKTNGSTIGVSQVYDEVEGIIEDMLIRNNHKGMILIKEIDLDRAMETKKIKVAQLPYDVEEEINEAISYVTPQILSLIFKRWGGELNRLEEIFVTGGGAILLEEAITEHFKNRTLQTFTRTVSSQYANLLGFYMRAVLEISREIGNEDAYELFVNDIFSIENEEE